MQKEEKMLERTLPRNPEAEMAVLGSMILNREVIGDLSLLLKADDFYVEKHGELFTQFLLLYEKNIDFDLVILKEHLEKAGVLERIGGAEYLVTADREVLLSRGYAGTEFITPGEFLKVLRSREDTAP